MSHYAKIENGIVTQVIVAEEDFIQTGALGDPARWVQTSYNTRGGKHYDPVTGEEDAGEALRANYAGIGYVYDATNDVFHAPRPLDMNGVECASWTIGTPEWLWTPPAAYPTDGKLYGWDEQTLAWVEIPAETK